MHAHGCMHNVHEGTPCRQQPTMCACHTEEGLHDAQPCKHVLSSALSRCHAGASMHGDPEQEHVQLTGEPPDATPQRREARFRSGHTSVTMLAPVSNNVHAAFHSCMLRAWVHVRDQRWQRKPKGRQFGSMLRACRCMHAHMQARLSPGVVALEGAWKGLGHCICLQMRHVWRLFVNLGLARRASKHKPPSHSRSYAACELVLLPSTSCTSCNTCPVRILCSIFLMCKPAHMHDASASMSMHLLQCQCIPANLPTTTCSGTGQPNSGLR